MNTMLAFGFHGGRHELFLLVLVIASVAIIGGMVVPADSDKKP